MTERTERSMKNFSATSSVTFSDRRVPHTPPPPPPPPPPGRRPPRGARGRGPRGACRAAPARRPARAPRPGARGGTRARHAAPITIHHGRGAQLSWPTNHEIVIHWIDIRRTLQHIQESLSSIQLVRPRPPQSGAPLARCGVAAATKRTDVGPGEQARAGFANSGTWSGSSDTQLRRPACAALTSGGLSSAAVGRAYLRACKRRWVLKRSSPMRKWRRVACGSTPRMLFGPSASSSLTMWHMKAGQHKRLPGVGIWVRPLSK